MSHNKKIGKLGLVRFSAALLAASVALSSCSTIATTIGDYKTNDRVLSGVRHNVKHLYDLAHTSVEDLPMQTIPMVSLAFFDFPFSLVADVLILPITIPYTLMNSDDETLPPAAKDGSR